MYELAKEVYMAGKNVEFKSVGIIQESIGGWSN